MITILQLCLYKMGGGTQGAQKNFNRGMKPYPTVFKKAVAQMLMTVLQDVVYWALGAMEVHTEPSSSSYNLLIGQSWHLQHCRCLILAQDGELRFFAFQFTDMGLPVVDADFMGRAFPELQVHMNQRPRSVW
jgi:hypothetical protein